MHPLAETFNINNRINVYLLNAINETELSDISAGKGRTVGEQFAHMHNVRLMWLKASAPDLLQSEQKIEKDTAITKNLLNTSLQQSATAMEKLLAQSAITGTVKGFKPHVTAFVGYLISHESHHRGQIILTLKENKHLPDKKILFGMWEWGTR